MSAQAMKQMVSALESASKYIGPSVEQGFIRLAIKAGQQALAQPEQEHVELGGVKEIIEEGDGFWRECSGCYETNEGYPPKGAYFSKVFKCFLGNGCDECGGIGAVWDNTDYEEMAKFIMDEDATQSQCKPLTDEPTKEMIDAAERIDWSDSDVRGNIVNMWQAMCSAAHGINDAA